MGTASRLILSKEAQTYAVCLLFGTRLSLRVHVGRAFWLAGG
jgi:hypothetical protein